MQLRLSTRTVDGVLVVDASGRIVFGEESASLRDAVKKLLGESPKVVLNLRDVTYIDSGGLGTLCDTLDSRVRELNYKKIRYQEHRDYMVFLINELRLGHRRDMLKEILENAIPVTFQDVVVIFCTASGTRKGQLVQISDARKIYGQTIGNEAWSAIQITTAAGVCALFAAGIYEGPEITLGLEYLKRHRDTPQNGWNDMHYFYGHYYASQAMWTAGGSYWQEWFPWIRDQLIERQREYNNGAWRDGICIHYGTAMACIILQIPNNYLPIMQK